MPLVVDASFAFRILVPEDDQSPLDRQLEEWQRAAQQLVAPSLWLYEMTTTVVKLAHFGQMQWQEAHRTLHLIHAFPIELVMPSAELTEAAFAWSRRLQRANAYDAFYVALAEALNCELWTFDRRLVRAANREWVRRPID